MEPIADITGFDVAVGTNATNAVATVTITRGTILWPPGFEKRVHPCSVSVERTGGARRVRVFLREMGTSMFEWERSYAAGIDGEQDMARGYYSNGLVIVGHVEIPGLSQALPAMSALERAEQSRREGSRKPRGSRRPKLDAWLDKQDLRATAAELFIRLPDADSDADVYRDGNTVVEVHRDRELQPLTYRSFANAVSRARKRSRLTGNHD